MMNVITVVYLLNMNILSSGTGQKPPDKRLPEKKTQTKAPRKKTPLGQKPPDRKPPNNDEKQKLMFFCYAFFYIDGDIRYIKVYRGKQLKFN